MGREYMISVDGATQTGYAIWGWEEELRSALIPPLEVGSIIPDPGFSWLEQVENMREQLLQVVLRWNNVKKDNWVTTMVVEYPQYIDTQGGHAAAKSGNLVKLCVAVGAVCAVGWECGMRVETMPLSWKGQCSKETVIRRIRRRLNDGDLKSLGVVSHGWDAIGLGLSKKGIKLST